MVHAKIMSLMLPTGLKIKVPAEMAETTLKAFQEMPTNFDEIVDQAFDFLNSESEGSKSFNIEAPFVRDSIRLSFSKRKIIDELYIAEYTTHFNGGYTGPSVVSAKTFQDKDTFSEFIRQSIYSAKEVSLSI